MMNGEINLEKLLNEMTPVLSDGIYIFASLERPSQELLSSLEPIGTFKENEGLTVILLKTKADEHGIEYEGLFKCITLNVHSSLDAIGLTAAVSSKLATDNISANIMAGFYHDHIFIAAKDGERALLSLKELA